MPFRLALLCTCDWRHMITNMRPGKCLYITSATQPHRWSVLGSCYVPRSIARIRMVEIARGKLAATQRMKGMSSGGLEVRVYL